MLYKGRKIGHLIPRFATLSPCCANARCFDYELSNSALIHNSALFTITKYVMAKAVTYGTIGIGMYGELICDKFFISKLLHFAIVVSVVRES
jgi:hypothetical protein